MKKLILLLVLVAQLSCGVKDKKQDQIKADVIENAFGEDLSYKVVATEKVKDVTYKDIYEVVLVNLETENESIDTLLTKMKKVQNYQKEKDNVELYHYFGLLIERLELVKAQPEQDAIAYTVYKHNYTIVNPMFNNALVKITKYYFFDAQDNLLYSVDEDVFKENKKINIQHSAQPFEAMIYLQK